MPFEVVFGIKPSSKPVSDLMVINEGNGLNGDQKFIYDSDGDNGGEHNEDDEFEDDGGHGDDDNDDINGDKDDDELDEHVHDNNAKKVHNNSPDPTCKNGDEFNSVPGK